MYNLVIEKRNKEIKYKPNSQVVYINKFDKKQKLNNFVTYKGNRNEEFDLSIMFSCFVFFSCTFE